MSGFTSFAVVGAGQLGGLLVNDLLARDVSVLVLTRPSSTKTFPEKVKVVTVEYSDTKAVAAILRENNVDVFISTLSGPGIAAQFALGDAAKESGVKLFVPSEFGMPSEGITDGFIKPKAEFAAHLKSIGLPSLRLYTGAFTHYIPFLCAIPETGKFLIVGSGNTAASWTALDDITGYLAYVLTVYPLSKLSNVVLRIQGDRATLSEIAKLYEGKLAVEYVDKLSTDIDGYQIKEFLQRKVEAGNLSTGWDPAAAKEGPEPAGSANALWEGHKWKSIKEVLKL